MPPVEVFTFLFPERHRRRIAISERIVENSLGWLERLEDSRFIPALCYLAALAVLVTAGLTGGFQFRDLTVYETAVLVVIAVPAVFLACVSLSGLACYFIFIPSIKHDSHLFSRVHGTHLIHPLTTAVVLGLAALCLVLGNPVAWSVWGGLFALFALQTAIIVNKVRREHLLNGTNDHAPGFFLLLLNLILGTEVVTIAAGAKPLAPWKLRTLPEDTWIVDVRTKPEFHWNRLQGAENYPWGAGVVEAARGKSKDRPVLVTCFSGHRSPTVAVMIRRLGFKTVYNLNWGLLYLVLLERGRKSEGPFSLTRPHRDPYRRGEDVRSISIGYITLQALILVIAPLENALRQVQVSDFQKGIGVALGIVGMALGALSFRGLGRNFRVFAAPRRSGTLITSGIYSRVRHPMYTGVILMFLGYLLFFGSLFSVPLWLAFSILYVIKSVKEEQILVERFPEYGDYARRSWKFIPYIY